MNRRCAIPLFYAGFFFLLIRFTGCTAGQALVTDTFLPPTAAPIASFPEAYMDGVLAEIQANYRVDDRRIYVTGLSIGGEAVYRFALHRPDIFAAIAPLSAYLDNADPAMMKRIRDLPVWAIHGSEDSVYSVATAQQPVDALKAAGGNIRFTVLEGFDHDVWTSTYLDPAFYEWLLEHTRID